MAALSRLCRPPAEFTLDSVTIHRPDLSGHAPNVFGAFTRLDPEVRLILPEGETRTVSVS
ncbi:MAG: hypothetical protein WCC90_20175 [Methylocella sp.]